MDSSVPQPAHVLAVSGVPGSGKSTLCRALVQALAAEPGGALWLAMDDYEQMTRMDAAALAAWTAAGADVNRLPLGDLAAHLAALHDGHPVRHPLSGALVAACRFVVFETQFGRTHAATGAHIDTLVWLDLPPDAALARSLRGFLAPQLRAAAPDPAELRWIDGYLAQYLGAVGSLVRQQAERVRPGADLVLDASTPTAAQVARVLQQLQARAPRPGVPL